MSVPRTQSLARGHRAAAGDGALPARRAAQPSSPALTELRAGHRRVACWRRSRTPGSPSATTQGWSVGRELVRVAQRADPQRALARRAQPVLDELAAAAKESAMLAVPRGRARLVDRRPGRRTASARPHQLGRPHHRRPPRLRSRQAAARRPRGPRRDRVVPAAKPPRLTRAPSPPPPHCSTSSHASARRAGPRSTTSPNPASPRSPCRCATPTAPSSRCSASAARPSDSTARRSSVRSNKRRRPSGDGS